MSAMTATYHTWFDKSENSVDWLILWIPFALVSFGVVMVASASIDFAALTYGDPWFYTKRHGIFVILSLLFGFFIFSIPTELWNRFSILLLLVGVTLLIAVLVPGLGREVNGARRWFVFGPISVQASEVAKFCFIIFFASFLARRTDEFKTSWSAFFKLIGILGLFVFLLLLEPDFGSSVVLCLVAGAMMFMAGVPIIRFILLTLTGVVGLALIAAVSPYRWQRLVTFLDPWSEQFSSGYQLVQSLIAFGRGEWFGLGLGNSLQKLFFLPEAHTDFIFAIVAEELGLMGSVVVILAFIALIYRILVMAALASEKQQPFVAYTCIGVGMLFTAQAFINMGVASGLLPTKGLTLPFISAGGSSLIICCGLIALLMRMNVELRK